MLLALPLCLLVVLLVVLVILLSAGCHLQLRQHEALQHGGTGAAKSQ
jgi:hypothetical protein